MKTSKMNRKITLIGTAVLMILFIITGCKKESSYKDDHSSLKDQFVNPYDYVGIWHNDGLMYILQNMDSIPTSVPNITAYFEKLYSRWPHAILPLDYSFPGDFPSDIANLNLYAWVSSTSYSRTFKNLVNNTLELLESSPGLPVIEDSVAIWEGRASRILSSSELNKYYEHLALVKYSAYFWSPLDQGGLDGIQYLKVKKKATMTINWWKVLGCDCIGGIVGGGAGYIGASCVSVIMQW